MAAGYRYPPLSYSRQEVIAWCTAVAADASCFWSKGNRQQESKHSPIAITDTGFIFDSSYPLYYYSISRTSKPGDRCDSQQTIVEESPSSTGQDAG